MGRSSRRAARGRAVDGILLLDKPTGISSNDALQRVKRIFNARKAGHTGNLDVQASGLLPVCFGQATKLCQFLLDADKQYLSQFRLGVRTSTGDGEGQTVEVRSTDGIDRHALDEAIAGFVGEIEQLPPMHSAIKHQGQPLYKLAHQGVEVERQRRPIRIYRFEVAGFDGTRVDVDVTCSKGTYIRTLAEDLGEVLGCGGHVAALRRARVGPFQLSEAWTVGDLEALAQRSEDAVDGALLAADSALPTWPSVSLSDDAAFYVAHGQAVLVPRAPTSGMLRIYDAEHRFMGVGEVLDDGRVAPRRLFSTDRAAPESGG